MKSEPTYLDQFADDILVRCPHCARPARLLQRTNAAGRRAGYRFVCGSCTRAQQWPSRGERCFPLPGAGPALSGFDLELWLQVPCCGETLWVYNGAHLAFLERYIAATLRERRPEQWGWSRNSTLESRLPRWMQLAKNRSAVLKGLARLRELMNEVA
jgi:hypothetical protein